MNSFRNHGSYGEQNAEVLGEILGLGYALTRSPDYKLIITATGKPEILSSDLGINLLDPRLLLPNVDRQTAENGIMATNQERREEASASLDVLAQRMTEHYEVKVSPDARATQQTYAARRIEVIQPDRPRFLLDLAYTALSDLNRPLIFGERLQFRSAEDLFESDGLDITLAGGSFSVNRTYYGAEVVPPSPEHLANLKQALQDFRSR